MLAAIATSVLPSATDSALVGLTPATLDPYFASAVDHRRLTES